MAKSKKKLVKSLKNTKIKGTKLPLKNKYSKKEIAQLADDIYRYDNEEFMDKVFKRFNIDNYEYNDDDPEDEQLSPEQKRGDDIFDEYIDLIDDEECTLYPIISNLNEKDKQYLLDCLYLEIDAGIN